MIIIKALIYLEDGTYYTGTGFGKVGTSTGELVFNTSMTGYQEILTDPSYAGQIITMTYPLIGNYGVNNIENESGKIHARGFIVKSISDTPSNHLCSDTVQNFLEKSGIVGVCGVDTRAITKKIRSSGALKCIISNENLSVDDLKDRLEGTKFDTDFVRQVSSKSIMHIEGKGHRVAVIDFGAKKNIIRNLKERDCDVTILPYNVSFEEILQINPEGVLLSNGPGDPKDVPEGIETVKKVMKKYPTFGICLGHQILALAAGGDTYKMKFGHRGSNHGVYDIDKDKAYITSQNHGYAVDPESIKNTGMVVTHINLNDNTVEGIRHSTLPVFSVQFHPEGSPGPTDSSYLFDKFISLL